MNLNPTNISIIKRLLIGRNSRPLQSILLKLPPVDVASLFSILNDRESRLLLDALISISRGSITLMELPIPQLKQVLKKIEFSTLLSLCRSAPEDHTAYMLKQLPEEDRDNILDLLDEAQKSKLLQLLSYPDGSAGQLMHIKFFSLNSNLTAAEGIEKLRQRAQMESIYYIYCVDEDRRLLGVISLRKLATAPANTPLHKLYKSGLVTVYPDSTQEEVAQIVSHYDYIAIPVVTKEDRLVGLITVDDILDVVSEQATANIYASAGLQEEDRVYSPAKTSIRGRLPWMVLNLALAFMASSVISIFEETIGTLIILASLNNIVAGLGGSTAVQALTVVTRGLSTGDFDFVSVRRAVLKETVVGVCLGIIVGLITGFIVYFWKSDLLVALVISIAMIINSLMASLIGSLIPLFLKKIGQDPAIGSSVLVTTLTDIFGFFTFLGLAALGLKIFGVAL